MCGIAGIYLKNKKAHVTDEGITEFCDRLLLEIEERGRHASGFVSVGWDKTVILDKQAKAATDFVKEREPFQKGVQAVLLHTRFWTKGKPEVMGNNHPVTYNTCFAVHNGSIANDDKLFKDEDLKRNFEVDSEAIPALLDKYSIGDLGSIRTALEKFQGPLAIAAIDPIRFPGRLLLAKGESSPLYVFENQNVIVWASTQKAIKETWGDLVGTPPKAEKIKWIPEGTFLLADDYGDLARYEYKVNPKPKTYTPPRTDGRAGSYKATDKTRKHIRPWEQGGVFESANEFYEAVREYRRTTEKTLARRWDLRSQYDDFDFADVNGVLGWYSCICTHSVLKNDMKTHFKYGSICIDCYEVVQQKWLSNGKDASEKSPAADIHIPEIPLQDRQNLEAWAEVEAKIHRYTLQDLSDLSGYGMQALDFLIFRTATGSSDFGVGMTRLKFALKRAYDAINESIHTDYGKEILEETEQDREVSCDEAQEIAEQQCYPWIAYTERLQGNPKPRVKYRCEVHGETFYFGEHCNSCLFVDYDEEGWPGEDREKEREACYTEECGVETFASVELERCPECKTFVVGPCPLCNEDKEVEIKVTVEGCSCKRTRNRACRRPLRIITENDAIGQHGYCARHWDKCGEGKCNQDANFTCLDGTRRCHTHSRRKQGIADAAAIKDGTLTIMEVN